MKRGQEWSERDTKAFQGQQSMRFHRKSLKVLKSTYTLRLIVLIKTERRTFQGQVTMICKTLRTRSIIEALLSVLERVKGLTLLEAKKANSNLAQVIMTKALT